MSEDTSHTLTLIVQGIIFTIDINIDFYPLFHDRLFVEKIVEHPEYKTADPSEKAFFKSRCKEVIPRLEKIKTSLLKTYQKDYEVCRDMSSIL